MNCTPPTVTGPDEGGRLSVSSVPTVSPLYLQRMFSPSATLQVNTAVCPAHSGPGSGRVVASGNSRRKHNSCSYVMKFDGKFLYTVMCDVYMFKIRNIL